MSTHPHRMSQIKAQTLKEEKERHQPRRRVDLINNPLDFRAAVLAGFGFSSKYIAAKTGLSAGQISYRLHKGHVRIADYRNGEGIVAERMLREHQEEVEPALRRHIAAALKADARQQVIK